MSIQWGKIRSLVRLYCYVEISPYSLYRRTTPDRKREQNRTSKRSTDNKTMLKNLSAFQFSLSLSGKTLPSEQRK